MATKRRADEPEDEATPNKMSKPNKIDDFHAALSLLEDPELSDPFEKPKETSSNLTSTSKDLAHKRPSKQPKSPQFAIPDLPQRLAHKTSPEADPSTPQSETDEEESAVETNLDEEDEAYNLKLKILLSHFTQAQLEQYEATRRSAFPKAAIRKTLDVKDAAQETGPLTPRHLSLAFERMEQQNKLFPIRERRNPFL
ncbi:HTAFII28-like protein region [Aphelenchoides besseyi]|nr:HTAFII28-like protein region [Aphelenchoides besseyi]